MTYPGAWGWTIGLALAAGLYGLGCASGGGVTETGAGGGATGDATGSGSTGTGAASGDGGGGGTATNELVDSACPSGEVALALSNGALVCDSPSAQLQSLLREGTSLAFGHRDACGANCSSGPIKWGTVDSTSCTDGAGADNSCTVQTIGGDSIEMLGLNLDGDVDENDKLYLGIHVDAPSSAADPHPGPCAPGEWVVGVQTDGRVTCASLASVAAEAARENCHVYFGWNDACSNCTSPPGKWGRTATTSCEHGMGLDSLCLQPMDLGGTQFQLYGLDLDGDVDENDKFYVGMQCDVVEGAPVTASFDCPAGTFVTEITDAGGVTCTPVDPIVAGAFAEGCTLHLGWADACNGCTTGPTRRGQVKSNLCINGVGANNICQTAMLGTNTVELFGLTTGGNVDTNDTFFVGLECVAPD